MQSMAKPPSPPGERDCPSGHEQLPGNVDPTAIEQAWVDLTDQQGDELVEGADVVVQLQIHPAKDLNAMPVGATRSAEANRVSGHQPRHRSEGAASG